MVSEDLCARADAWAASIQFIRWLCVNAKKKKKSRALSVTLNMSLKALLAWHLRTDSYMCCWHFVYNNLPHNNFWLEALQILTVSLFSSFIFMTHELINVSLALCFALRAVCCRSRPKLFHLFPFFNKSHEESKTKDAARKSLCCQTSSLLANKELKLLRLG